VTGTKADGIHTTTIAVAAALPKALAFPSLCSLPKQSVAVVVAYDRTEAGHVDPRHTDMSTCEQAGHVVVSTSNARPMPTIAIISQKGGAGKTTLALHLAAAAQEAGQVSLVIDTDPQATASQWAAWRGDAPPEVIDSPPPRLAAKVEAAKGQGATLIVIDTPPHADSAARAAVEVADLVLIPCRPSAFDLSAIQTTAKLMQLLRKPAYVVFTAGNPNAPRIYAEAGELVDSYGTPPCPVTLPDRAAYRHASAEGRTVTETEPAGKAAGEVRELYKWTCLQLDMPTPRKRKAKR
jgi:chromosome partitioning protein